MRLRQLDGDDRVRLAGGEQTPREHLDTHRGRPLPHPDHHRAVPDHVHVAAFDRRRQVVQVVVAVVGDESASANIGWKR